MGKATAMQRQLVETSISYEERVLSLGNGESVPVLSTDEFDVTLFPASGSSSSEKSELVFNAKVSLKNAEVDIRMPIVMSAKDGSLFSGGAADRAGYQTVVSSPDKKGEKYYERTSIGRNLYLRIIAVIEDFTAKSRG